RPEGSSRTCQTRSRGPIDLIELHQHDGGQARRAITENATALRMTPSADSLELFSGVHDVYFLPVDRCRGQILWSVSAAFDRACVAVRVWVRPSRCQWAGLRSAHPISGGAGDAGSAAGDAGWLGVVDGAG